jgi:hypothetical protein
MGRGLLHLAAALRDAVAIEEVVIARVASAIDPGQLDRMRRSQAALVEAAALLAELAPHECLVREAARIGLVDFPTFSAQVGELRPGSIALLRAAVIDPHPGPGECLVRVVFETGRLSQLVVVRRRDIIGVEKREPPAPAAR